MGDGLWLSTWSGAFALHSSLVYDIAEANRVSLGPQRCNLSLRAQAARAEAVQGQWKQDQQGTKGETGPHKQ